MIKKPAKKAAKKEAKPEVVAASSAVLPQKERSDGKYYEAVGRRKTAIARVRVSRGAGGIVVNGKDLKEYFRGVAVFQKIAAEPIEELKSSDKFSVSVRVRGGGIRAQAEALRHGLSRALLLVNEIFKKPLRRAGFLTRDSRMVERKKYGKKKARRSPQWKKR